MVDYKGKIGIYKAKSQAKYLGEPTVEYHQQRLKTGDFKGILQRGEDERSKFRKVPKSTLRNFARCSSWCEIAKFRTMRKIPLRNGVPIACARVST